MRDIGDQLLAIGQMVGVAEHRNIRVKILQGMLGVRRGQREGLGHFFVHDDIHPHATNGRILQHAIQSVFLILSRRSSEVEFRRQPP